jgi:hypothetical protein
MGGNNESDSESSEGECLRQARRVSDFCDTPDEWSHACLAGGRPWTISAVCVRLVAHADEFAVPRSIIEALHQFRKQRAPSAA